jgi:CitMHS family citrate-Mg2+:H+ or citrate-Ca2+:H+ symporter
MLTIVGAASIALLLALILFRVTSVIVALTLVPVAAGLVAGFGAELGSFALAGIQSVAATAALLAFAVMFFGVMNDAGLFAPLIAGVIRITRQDPLRVVIGTAVIAMIAHLDGAGAATFLVTVPAMLPIYDRLKMDRLTLTCTVALAAGTMNVVPWGGPTGRAATALQVGMSDLFNPLIPAVVAGLAAVFGFAALLGSRERRRVQVARQVLGNPVADRGAKSPALRSRWWFNLALTIASLAALLLEILPLAVIFMIAFAVALIVNFPSVDDQRERLNAHGSSAMQMVTIVLAAGMFTGIMTKSGMLGAMATALVQSLPNAWLQHLPVVTAVASMPLSLAFDPDSFYFGVLPILGSASQAAGVAGIEVGRAAILGQMTTGFPVSPLTPATFLLLGLAGVDLGDHQRRTIPYAFAVTLIMTAVALLTGAFRF